MNVTSASIEVFTCRSNFTARISVLLMLLPLAGTFRSLLSSPNKCEYCSWVDWMSVIELLDLGKFIWNTSLSRLRRLRFGSRLGEWGSSENDLRYGGFCVGLRSAWLSAQLSTCKITNTLGDRFNFLTLTTMQEKSRLLKCSRLASQSLKLIAY